MLLIGLRMENQKIIFSKNKFSKYIEKVEKKVWEQLNKLYKS